MPEPAYLTLLRSGELEQRAELASTQLASCSLCPWHCKANRLAGKRGVCQGGALARVASYGPHHGEERPLSGTHGSGTVFFSRCNLRCVFCQNHEISQADAGPEVSAEELADIFLDLQEHGCHNINLVSPSHVIPQILSALVIAARAGLRLPLVYNTGGYDSPETLALLDGIIDLYLPDLKFSDPSLAKQYSGARDYPAVSQAAVLEMQRQVGDLIVDEEGIAQRGLIIRHLVLPGGAAGTRAIAGFVATKVSAAAYFNLMDQYHPANHSAAYPQINRPPSPAELRKARQEAETAGLRRLTA